MSQECNFTLNQSKRVFKVRVLNLLGYSVKDGEIKPVPEPLLPLWNLPLPKDSASLRKAVRLFVHYFRWMPNFSQKIHRLSHTNSFPLQAFVSLKKDIASAVLMAADPASPFTMETDASDFSREQSFCGFRPPQSFPQWTRRLFSGESLKHCGSHKEVETLSYNRTPFSAYYWSA